MKNISKDKLRFDKITPQFYDKFLALLINQKNMLNNTAYKMISFLKTFMIWANTNNFTDNTSHKSFKGKTEQNEVIYLTNDELEHLYTMKIENERLDRVRDVFVFQCCTGVRYGDIENISREDIKGNTWHLRTQKTKDIIEVPLTDKPLSILAKYSGLEKPLPIISNQKMNRYVKELCNKAGINDKVKIVQYQGTERKAKTYKKYEVIGSHTARRTFITLSLQKGMPSEVIMAITGHRDFKMMRRYLKIADSHKREEMEKAWGSSLRIVN